MKILKRLAKRTGKKHAIRIESQFPSQAKRDEVMRFAKVIVQLRKFDEMGLVSSSRCNTSINLGRPVVAEAHDLSKPWDEIVHFVPALTDDEKAAAIRNDVRIVSDREKLFDFECDRFCNAAMAVRAAWRQVHEGQWQRFKEKLSPDFCWGGPLRQIGILPSNRAAA